MWDSFFSYFTDAILRGPTIGSMLMCLVSAIVGVIVFLRKESLVGESLAHAAYPGVIAGAIACGLFAVEDAQEAVVVCLMMGGAFLTAMLGLLAIQSMQRKLSVPADASLCFILSSFFGIGVTLASQVQFIYPRFYRQVQIYLFGQAATMTDIHIWIYCTFALLIVGVVALLYKEIQMATFDREFAKSLGLHARVIDAIIFSLVVLALVIGIRSVGVVLMTAMLIAPAASARQMTHRMSRMFIIAGFFGAASGFLGNYLSVELTEVIAAANPTARLSLPTGPMIVLVATLICILSLMFGPKKGLVARIVKGKIYAHRLRKKRMNGSAETNIIECRYP